MGYLIAAIFVHLFYFYSALLSHTLDYFIPAGTIHSYQGWDYYQIPNGAYSFIRGGELTGIPPLGTPPYSYGSENVYHPFFTLILGYPLQLLYPYTGFLLWEALHLIITIICSLIFMKRYSAHKYARFAIIVYLVFFPNYLEIWNGQYHFLLSTALLFLLMEFEKNKDNVKTGLLYAASLLVKPIGILWAPVFLHGKKWNTLTFGLLIYIVATLIFSLNGHDYYYISNLFVRIVSPFGGPPSIFSLDSVLRYLNMGWYLSPLIKLAGAVCLFLLTRKKGKCIFEMMFVWTAYYLTFYDLVFEYHYLVLVPFFMVGLVSKKIFQTKYMRAMMIWLAMPTPFFIMRYFQIGADGESVTGAGWILLVVFRLVPLFISAILVLRYILDHHKVLTSK